MKIRKPLYLVVLSVLLVLGSFVTFYATNLFMVDVCNMSSRGDTFFATIPLLMIAISFTMAILGIYRLYQHPEYKKQILKRYTIVIACLAAIGAVFAFYTGLVVYKDFFTNYVFKNYPFIMAFDNLLITGLAVYARLSADKLEDDKEKEPKGFLRGFYSVACGLVLYYAMNKFGAVLWLPSYCQWSSLYVTFIVYLSLLLPMAYVVVVALTKMGIIKNAKLASIFVLSFTLILQLGVIIVGYGNPLLISAVSTAHPLERLASMPIDTIFRTVLMIGLSIYFEIKTLKH